MTTNENQMKYLLKLFVYFLVIFITFLILFCYFVKWKDMKFIENRAVNRTIKNPYESYFHHTMTPIQKSGMLDLLALFKSQMDKFNITFSLYGGSLIGAVRHQGFIPWDDDIDLIVWSSFKSNMISALEELNQTHNLISYDGKETGKWKFYKLDGKKFSHKPFRYPYLDIFFLKEFNETMFKVEIESYFIKKKHMFPLILRNFDNLQMPTPCATDDILEYMYGDLNKCTSPSWNHSTEYFVSSSNWKTVSCDLLKPFYPFTEKKVHKMKNQFRIEESLKLGPKPIHIAEYYRPLRCLDKLSHFNSKLSIKRLK